MFLSQRAGKLMKEWKTALSNDSSANLVVATTGSKRKAVGLVSFRDIGINSWLMQYRMSALTKQKSKVNMILALLAKYMVLSLSDSVILLTTWLFFIFSYVWISWRYMPIPSQTKSSWPSKIITHYVGLSESQRTSYIGKKGRTRGTRVRMVWCPLKVARWPLFAIWPYHIFFARERRWVHHSC